MRVDRWERVRPPSNRSLIDLPVTADLGQASVVLVSERAMLL